MQNKHSNIKDSKLSGIQYDADFVKKRAQSYKIDIVGRLEWIEAAWTMIQSAKKSQNETFSRS